MSGGSSATWLIISGGDEGGVAIEPFAGSDGGAATAVISLAAATWILRGNGMRMPRYIRESGMMGAGFLDTPNQYRGLEKQMKDGRFRASFLSGLLETEHASGKIHLPGRR